MQMFALGKGIWGGDREEMGGVRGRRDQRTHIKDRGADKGKKRLKMM